MKLHSLLPLLASVGGIYAEEMVMAPKIESVGLFKNGLCVVRGSFEAPMAGIYRWENPPRTVQGTFQVDAGMPVTVQSTERALTEALQTEQPTGNLQSDLAGAEVRLTLSGDPGKPFTQVTGTVWAIPPRPVEPRQWEAAISSEVSVGRAFNNNGGNVQPMSTGAFLVLETTGAVSRLHVALSSIAQIEVLKPAAPHQQTKQKALWLFQVSQPGTVHLSYLARGASWVPSYFVDLTDPKKLRLRQSAIVKNELMPFADTELQLISGFPNVTLGSVDSPLWQGISLAGFFQQLSSLGRGGNVQSLMMQNTTNSYGGNRMNEGARLPDLAEPSASSEDLHFESLGKRNLAAGEALLVEVASGDAGYERVVEWIIPDTRDGYGRIQRRGEPTDEEQPWDAVLFKNPLKFPMTTAAATISQDGKFRGQSQCTWTNPGQRSCLRVTKALSIQTDHGETEVAGKRVEEIWMGGNRYYRATVKGQATVRNFRATTTTVLMRAQFSGRLDAAEDKPTDTLRTEGVYSVNPRHELEWKLTLEPNAEKTVTYEYNVLVGN